MNQTSLVRLVIIVLASFLARGVTQTAFAQWSNDPNVNTPVATQLYYEGSPQLCSDGSGGTIIAWMDERTDGYHTDIYTQRLNSSGVAQWATDGVAICTATADQYLGQIVSDGAGGAIITWNDNRSGWFRIYAQRVNSSGVVQWTTNGVAVCPEFSAAHNPLIAYKMISDGAGGAIITWNRTDSWDIYVQRVNSSGVVQWTTNGVAICTADDRQTNPQLVSDGSGGAIITWLDWRSGGGYTDIYAQRVHASGAAQWTTNGVAICAAPNRQLLPRLISDGSGGAIITWYNDNGNAHATDVYAQRVNSSGVVQWATNGIAVYTESISESGPQVISDGSGGAIITWSCWGSGSSYDIYAQRLNPAGIPQWTANGREICTASNGQSSPQLVGDGSGGAIITWVDDRSGSVDIFAQRVNSSGVVQWTTNGVAICTAANNQYSPQLTSDGSGGAIITWNDNRNGNGDIYAQNINRNGQLGMTAPSIIANGQFEQGTSNWTMYSAAPNGINFSTVPGGPSGSYAKVHINATSNNMQVYQTYFPLTAGKRYTLGFDAYSPTSRKVFVTVHKHGAPYGSYGFGEWIQLGPNWTHYERQFTAGGFSGTTSDTRLRFYFVYACGAGDDYYFDNVSLAQVLAKSGEEQIAEQPTSFRLEQNYPNPFNPTTTIKFSVGTYGHTFLRVYDVLGREVAILVDEVRDAGVYEAVFDATNLSSGMYFYKLESGSFVQTKKMIIMK